MDCLLSECKRLVDAIRRSGCGSGSRSRLTSIDALRFSKRRVAGKDAVSQARAILECAGTRLRCASTRPDEVQLAAPKPEAKAGA